MLFFVFAGRQPLTPRTDPRYDADGNVIETHEHAGDFKEW
jgi:hypothetical protein